MGFCSGSDRSVQNAALEKEVLSDARRTFRPEFWGRLDEALVFQPLNEEELCWVANQMLRHTRSKFAELGIAMELHPQAAVQLAHSGADPVHGARTLRRTITGQIEDPAADLLLSGALTAGRTLNILPGEQRVQLQIT